MTDNDVADIRLNTHLDHHCDESKCVSSLLLSRKGGYKNNNNNENNEKVPTFMCYAEGKGVLPFACAEGYEGFVVENEPPFLYDGKNLSYYTCCLPPQTPTRRLLSNSTSSSKYVSSSSSSPLGTLSHQRHCNNTIVIGNNEEGGSRVDTNLCDGNSSVSEFDSSQKKEFPRNMTRSYGHLESYMCCDELLQPPSLSNNDNTSVFNYLDDVDCVPYLCTDIFDYDCISKNRYSVLQTMTCNDNLYNGTFVFPKVVATNNNEIRFECCKAGTKEYVLPKNTQAFKLTYGSQLVLSLIALVFLLVFTISLLRPLVMKGLKCKSENVPSETTPSAAASSQPYSSYNLYLVYVLSSDLVYNIFYVWQCSSAFAGQTYKLDWNGISEAYPTNVHTVVVICSTANICMNAVIAFEVFKFLENSFELVRDPAPTLRRVTLQAIGVYVYSCVVPLTYAITWNHYIKTEQTEKSNMAKRIGFPLLLLCTVIGPFVFLIYICIMIWKRGYIKTTDHHYKHLAIYFLRIIVVFILFWVPVAIMAMLKNTPTEIGYGSGTINIPMYADESAPPLLAIIHIMISLQAIATVCMALFKPDVQKMVMDLFTTCSCCCCCCCYDDNNNNQVDNGSDSGTYHNRHTTPS